MMVKYLYILLMTMNTCVSTHIRIYVFYNDCVISFYYIINSLSNEMNCDKWFIFDSLKL
jgi:hypothetical protein